MTQEHPHNRSLSFLFQLLHSEVTVWEKLKNRKLSQACGVANLERMLGHQTLSEFERFEAECLEGADVHEVDLALSNALRMKEFFTQRVGFLQAKRERNYANFK
jgi:hypothetical protein